VRGIGQARAPPHRRLLVAADWAQTPGCHRRVSLLRHRVRSAARRHLVLQMWSEAEIRCCSSLVGHGYAPTEAYLVRGTARIALGRGFEVGGPGAELPEDGVHRWRAGDSCPCARDACHRRRRVGYDGRPLSDPPASRFAMDPGGCSSDQPDDFRRSWSGGGIVARFRADGRAGHQARTLASVHGSVRPAHVHLRLQPLRW